MSSDNRHKPLDEKQQYRDALEVLRHGGLVALPTDTVYGLCAVAADVAAVRRLYELKRRPLDQPLPVFVASAEQAELVVEMTAPARALAERFWPGQLTIVLPKKPSYATAAAASGDTIGVRVPDDPVIREMAAQLGPLTGTSANVSGEREAHSAAEVRAQLGDDVDLVVDAPVQASGRPSTVVDCTDPTTVRVVRAGAVEREALDRALAGVSTLI